MCMKVFEDKAGRRDTPVSMLETIKEKLRPLLIRRFAASKALARRVTAKSEMSDREKDLYVAGFEHGWIRGASDATEVSPSDLLQYHPKNPETH